MKRPFEEWGANSIKAACENNESRSSPGWWPPTGFFSHFPWGFEAVAGQCGRGGSLVLVPGEHIGLKKYLLKTHRHTYQQLFHNLVF